MKIELPKQVARIIRTLEDNGFEAFAVGGCVRDSVLGRTPNDWDITTSALPLEIKGLFKRTIDTGIQHGTVTVLEDGIGYEVTTYRIDGEYEDSRHPKEVIFTENLREDLRRRDFTINAMAYNERAGLVDAFHGLEDLENGIVRCVGNAEERFTEDALRVMRAVRFSAQLGFTIAEETKEAAKKLAPNLEKISAERIQTELLKLLVSGNPDYLKTAWELGITAVILPEFDAMMRTPQNTPHHCFNVGEHTLHACKGVRPDKVLRLAMLFHDCGKPLVRSTDEDGKDHFYGHADVSAEMASEIMRRLKLDNDTIHQVKRLVRFHDWRPTLTDKAVRRMIYRTGEEIFPLLLEVERADICAQSDYQRKEKLETLDQAEALYQEILARKQCLSLKTLAVTGKDLIADGMKPGKELGNVLNKLLEDVLEEPSHNTKEYLLEYSRSLR
ncbi:MAG: CCA tRNA nucleotidyltransferase [Eubacteriales bacterium]|nr:CCA tRNA nucleotidyltransferase [Eubacteriales bacterium]